MINIIFGNITSLISCLLDSYSTTKKNKKDMLTVQCFSVVVYAISNSLLKAYSTVVQNVCALFRNILAANGIKNRTVEYIIVAASLIFGIYFNNLGFIGLLPVFGNVEYSICMFALKDNVKGLKLSFLICNICFIILNFFISNYVGLFFTFITALTTLIELIRN